MKKIITLGALIALFAGHLAFADTLYGFEDGNYYSADGTFQYLCFEDGSCINSQNQIISADSLGITPPGAPVSSDPVSIPSAPVSPIVTVTPDVAGSAPIPFCTISLAVESNPEIGADDLDLTWTTVGFQDPTNGVVTTMTTIGSRTLHDTTVAVPQGQNGTVVGIYNSYKTYGATFTDTSGDSASCSAN